MSPGMGGYPIFEVIHRQEIDFFYFSVIRFMRTISARRRRTSRERISRPQRWKPTACAIDINEARQCSSGF